MVWEMHFWWFGWLGKTWEEGVVRWRMLMVGEKAMVRFG